MKNITFFIGPFGSGGGERNCRNLANAFSRKGIKVTVVALDVLSDDFVNRFDPEVRFINLKRRNLRMAIFPILAYLLNEKPDKVLAFNHYIATALQIMRSLFFIRFELYMRNIIGLTKKYEMNKSFWQSKITRHLVKVMLKRTDGIISQCVAMREDLERNWEIVPARVKVIYNPIAEEVERAHSPSNDKRLKKEILFVGRLSEEKGVDVLIRSASKLILKYPDLKVRILGEGRLEKELKALTHELNLVRNIEFVGFTNDPIPYYQSASVKALPSFSEGFPNVLIEALSLGTPVVAFDCETGPSEIIDENNGYLVGLGNEEEFTSALDKALTREWNFNVEKYRQAPIVSQYLDFLGLS